MKRNGYILSMSIFIWAIFFVFSFLMALDPQNVITQYQLNSWQRERGLEQRSVVSICQTQDGYLWLGTFEGLVRFDGTRFKTFNKDNTAQFADNLIWALIEDKEKNVWIGTAGGLSCLKEGQFKTYPLEEYPSIGEIFTMIEARSGGVWIGTKKNGLIHLKDDKPTYYTTANGLISNKIYALSEDKDGRLWVGMSGGLSIASTQSPGTFTTFKGKDNVFENKQVLSILHSQSGALWVGCSDGLYRQGNNEIHHYAQDFTNSQITSLFEDSHQNLWAGTDGSGLIRIRGEEVERFPENHRLRKDHIYAIHEDNEQNIWIGSSKNGLYMLKDTLFTPFTISEDLNHNDVNCIYIERGNTLLLGTVEGVNRLENGKLTSLWTTKNGLLNNDVTAILKDDQERVWIGTDKGLNRYNNGKFESVDTDNRFKDKRIEDIQKDNSGAIWILELKKIWKYAKGQYTDFSNVKGELRRIYIDKYNHVWVATYNDGFYSFQDGKFIPTTTKDYLVSNQVESFFKDKEGILYIGTRGGLSILLEGNFYNITTKTGLLDSFVRHIIEDDLGYLWLTGRTGFSRINKEELLDVAKKKKKRVNSVIYNDSHGLKGLYCSGCVKTADGKLWFATDRGLAMIDPAKIINFTRPIPTLIEELIADGETYYIGNTHYGKNNPLALPPGTRKFEFNYTGFRYANPFKIKFQYQLEGYEDKWVDRGTIRNISFNDLSPGRYTFRVKAGKSEDNDAVSMSFYLKPHIYETLWFYAAGILFTLFTIFSIYRVRVRQFKIRQKVLAAEIKLRTREVVDKNRQLEHQSEKLKELDHVKSRFFANISHEFRTPLTLLIGPLEHLIDECTPKESDRKRKLILMMRNSQRLLRLINQLMELSKMDSGKMKLKLIQTGIIAFIRGITDSFKNMVQQKELDLVFQSHIDDQEIDLFLDPCKMEDIMSNLLINALKFTPPGGEILVSVKKNPTTNEKFPDGLVEVSVADTGPGISGDQLPYVFDRFYQADATYEHHLKGTGIGLALTKELVALHGGTITVKNRDIGGSEFILCLPRSIPTNRKSSSINREDDPLDTDTYTILMEDDFNPPSAINPFVPQISVSSMVQSNDTKNIILIVEDSADMREYIKVALEPQYIVEEAIDGNEGIEKAKAMIPDLIVSDIMMPGKDGNELCRTLKADVETSHIPIIMLTAKASEEYIIEGLETGADDYITKPFSTKILSARIKNLIDLRSQLQQNFKREINLRPVKTSVSAIDREFLKELQTVLKKNLSEPDFNVEGMCKQLYMSNTTLYRKIQALCGLSPTEFIRSYRLKRAAELLKNGFGSVTEVAFEVGFSSRAYFTKCFKERFNQLPSEVHSEL
jgi:signal transduction histidine kinase/ligand-binding sensor domain-containing protein/DNA-binding response OmpR family regulator